MNIGSRLVVDCQVDDVTGEGKGLYVRDTNGALVQVVNSSGNIVNPSATFVDVTTTGNTILGNAVTDTLTISGSTQLNATTVNTAQALVSLGTIVTGTGINISANTARVAGYSANLYNTANTVTGLRGSDLRVADDGSTGSHPIVAVQGVATKTSGASTSELWGGNLIAHVNGGKVENVYGLVGQVDSTATASIGTSGAPINYAAAVLGVSYLDTSTTLATEFIDAAIIGKIDQGTNNRKKATGAIVALLGGDNGTTVQAGAAFKVVRNNSTSACRFDYGLDNYYSDGTFTNIFAIADIRLSGNVNVFSGVAITRAAVRAAVGDTAPQGSLFIGQGSVATTKPNMYIKVLNAGADTDWERIVTAATD